MQEFNNIYKEFLNFDNNFNVSIDNLNSKLKIFCEDLFYFTETELKIFKIFIIYYYSRHLYIISLKNDIFTELVADNNKTKGKFIYFVNNEKNKKNNGLGSQIRFLLALYLSCLIPKIYIFRYINEKGYNFEELFSNFIYFNNFDNEYIDFLKEINFVDIIKKNHIKRIKQIEILLKKLKGDTCTLEEKFTLYYQYLKYISIFESFPEFITIELSNTVNKKCINKDNFDEQVIENAEKIYYYLIQFNKSEKHYFRVLGDMNLIAKELISNNVFIEKTKFNDIKKISFKESLYNLNTYQNGEIIFTSFSSFYLFELIKTFIKDKIFDENGYLSILIPYIRNNDLPIYFADKINRYLNNSDSNPLLKFQIVISDIVDNKIEKLNTYLDKTNHINRNIGIYSELHKRNEDLNNDLIEKFDLIILNPHNTILGLNTRSQQYKYQNIWRKKYGFSYNQKISTLTNLKYLKKGGILLYLTNSFLYTETIEINNIILKFGNIEPIPLSKFASNRIQKHHPELIESQLNYITILPTISSSESFFISIYKKI